MHKQNVERRLWLAVDMVGYGILEPLVKERVQRDLRRLLGDAAVRAGLQREKWDTQEAGDGEICAIPSEEPEARVVDDFVRHLLALVHSRNAQAAPNARIRLRLAIHRGPYSVAGIGWGGDSPVTVKRMVDSDPVRNALDRDATADLAVIICREIYKEIVIPGWTTLAREYFSDVEARGKTGEEVTQAHLWVPGVPSVPLPPHFRWWITLVVIGIAAVAGILLLVAVFQGRIPGSLPTAHVTVPKGPYHSGSVLTAHIRTASPVSDPSTRRLRMTITNYSASQVLCVAQTKVSATLEDDGTQLGHWDSRNSIKEISLGAGQTDAKLNLKVHSKPDCLVNLSLVDVTDK